MRYKQVEEFHTNNSTPNIRSINRICLVLGSLAAFGMSLVANFQVNFIIIFFHEGLKGELAKCGGNLGVGEEQVSYYANDATSLYNVMFCIVQSHYFGCGVQFGASTTSCVTLFSLLPVFIIHNSLHPIYLVLPPPCLTDALWKSYFISHKYVVIKVRELRTEENKALGIRCRTRLSYNWYDNQGLSQSSPPYCSLEG